MNSRKTLTCNLFHLPQDIFRVIFQYLSIEDLMKGEEAFLNNQELLSLYRSSLAGFTLKEKIPNQDEENGEELLSWIIDRKLLVDTLELYQLRNLEMNLLSQSRYSLQSITFHPSSTDPVNPQLGHFPLLTSVTIWGSNYFTKDKLLSFFSHNPQLENVEIDHLHDLSNEILLHLSDYCPKIKILTLNWNDWVNDETMSLLTQQRLFPNLKSLDIYRTSVTNQESVRQFILSRPLLSELILPADIEYSNDFLAFYLRQFLFPSILNQNNDLESHSLAISSICNFVGGRILDGRNDVVNPEIFSMDILSHLYHKDCSFDTLDSTVRVFIFLSNFPSMIPSVLQSQFIPTLLDSTRAHDFLFPGHLVDLLINCGVFHDQFPLLAEKYRTHPSSLMKLFHQAVEYHFPSLTAEELQAIIPIVLSELRNKDSTATCLTIISQLLQQPSSQHLIDPNHLLLSFKSIALLNYNINGMINCLKRFISVNKNYRQLFIESNLFPQIMRLVDPSYLINFANDCLSSRYELLVDHLVDSGLLQYLLSKYSHSKAKRQIESLFERCLKTKNSKQYKIVTEMELPNELKSKLFEKEKTKKRTNKMRR